MVDLGILSGAFVIGTVFGLVTVVLLMFVAEGVDGAIVRLRRDPNIWVASILGSLIGLLLFGACRGVNFWMAQ